MGTLTGCLLQHPLGKVQAQRLRALTKTYGKDPQAAVKAAEDMLAELHAERDDLHAQIVAKGGAVPEAVASASDQQVPAAAPKAKTVRAATVFKPPAKVRGSYVLGAISKRLDGLSPDLLPDLSERVQRVRVSKLGKRTQYVTWDNPAIPKLGALFRLGGSADMSLIAQLLEEEGFLTHGSVEDDPLAAAQQAGNIVRAELRQGGVTLRIGDPDEMEAEYRRRADAANDTTDTTDTTDSFDSFDPFDPSNMDAAPSATEDWTLTVDDLADSGYEKLSPHVAKATDGLLAEAEALGIDTSELRLDVSEQERLVTQSPDAYHAKLQAAARSAIARALAANRQAAAGAHASGARTSDQGRGEAAGAESSAGTGKPPDGQARRPDAADAEETALTLEAQSPESLREKTEREAAATAAEQAEQAAEQTRLRKEAEARDDKRRADQTVDDFQLGQSAEQQLSGIDDLFSQNETKPETASAEDLDAMFDSLLAEKTADVPGGRIAAQKAAKARTTPRPRKPKAAGDAAAPATPATPEERTAAAAAASAARNGAAALNDAIDGLGKLFGGGGKLNSGLSFDEESYAKAKPLFIQALAQLKTAGSDLREAMSKLIDMLLAKYGPQAAQNMKPYVVRFVTDVRAGKVVLDADNADSLKGTRDAPTADTAVERDRQDAAADPAAVEADVQTGRRQPDEGNRGAGGPAGEPGGRPAYSAGVPADGAAAGRERGHQPLHRGDGEQPPAGGAAGAGVDQRSADAGDQRVSPDPIADGRVEDAADVAGNHLEKLAAQRAANALAVAPGLDNVRATLPYLLSEQQEDVHKAEQRFAQDDGYGMLFTNSAGTGKTFTGLGVIKRRAMQGDTNTLVVVPDAKIMADWVKSATALGLTVTPLENTKDAGKGVTITTYANLGDNDALARRQWGLIVPDEAHKLMQSEDGEQTKALDALRALALHPRGVRSRFDMLNRADLARQEALSQRMRANDKARTAADTPAAERARLAAEKVTLAEAYKVLVDKLAVERAKVQAHHEANQGAKRTRVMGLSATPFAYEKTVDWADGLLFDYGEGYTSSKGYNAPNPHQSFFMRHFGWMMKNGKLNEPGKLVDRGLMQRQFHSWMVKRGVLSGRDLVVEPDYDRRFILAESAVGTEIDRALAWLQTRRSEVNAALTKAGDKATTNGFSLLEDELHGTFYGPLGHLVRRYLLEAIKAKEVVRHVREHMALGRKVVVFHDFNKGGSTNPFMFFEREVKALKGVRPADLPQVQQGNERAAAFNDALAEFDAAFPGLTGGTMLGDLVSPIERFTKEFPDVLLVNGLQKKRDVLAAYASFQDDANGPQVMLVQSDKNAGWSGHDTTGKHPRVLFNLGLPTQPTKTTQQEGRIYRTGQASNAMFRYLNTGTNWERWAFATTIAERASAAENLAKGEGARALKDAYIDGFEESGDYPAGHEGEGTGGKERDRARAGVLTLFDRAKTFYFGQQKKTSRTKAAEGADYFATPEPVGLKMVEWADLRGGEDALEPSAGHGAIARWFGDNVLRTAIEPSAELASRLALVFDGKVIQGTFENLNVVNKYDAIVMNPPFGTAGRTAIDHLAKAATHLREGGRIVALIPAGPSADAKFEKWMYEDSTRPAKPLYVSPEHGPIYEGDTLVMKNFGAEPLKMTVGHIDGTGSGPRYARPKGERVASGVNLLALDKVLPTGKRTENFSASAGLHLVADIKLPASTFERAGTKVMTRIVVIEKPMPGQSAPQQVNRDLSDAEDIGALFERLQNLTIQPRAKVVAAGAAAAADARSTADASPAPTPNEKAVSRADGAELAAAAGLTVVPYTTKKDKTIQGVIVTHLTHDEAKEVDPYTWKRDGGFFIRTEHMPTLLAKYPPPAAGSGRLNTVLLRLLSNFAALGGRHGTARQGMQDAESKLNIRLGLTLTRDDSLGLDTPAAVDLDTGEVLYNPRYNTLTRGEWAQSMAEEILHAVDIVGPSRAMSASSTRLAIGTGDIALEAQAVFDSSRGLADYLSYPFAPKFGLTAPHQQAELFARLGVLYHGDQALMQRSLPIAYEAFHVLFAATPTGFDSRLLKDVRRADPRARGLGGSPRGQDSGLNGSRGQGDGRQATDQGLDALRANIARIFDADPAGGTVGGRRVKTRGAPDPQNIAANSESRLSRLGTQFAAQGYERVTVPQVQAARAMRKLVDEHAAGTISEGTLAMRMGILADRRAAAADAKAVNRLMTDRVRGVDFVREKLLAARRRGELAPEAVGLALWALDKNPALAENLGISVLAAPEDSKNASGDYNPAAEIIRLFTNKADPETAVHEILHHAERMMPPDMQAAIRREWARALAAAIKTGTPEQVAALKLVPEAMTGDRAAYATLVKAIQQGPLNYDEHYPLVNPSEFWAVNGARILTERYAAKGSVWARIGQWLRELVEKARGLVGLPSTAPVVRALNRVLDAKQNAAPRDGKYGREKVMLADGTLQSASAMKSVDANIARGREAMNRALLGKQTVHRAMFRNGLGWVDFEWGDAKRGVQHIIERRMESDGLTHKTVIDMLTGPIVEAIARGTEIRRITSGGSTNLRIDHEGHRVALVKNAGSNAWLLSGFEKVPDGEARVATRSLPTQAAPTLISRSQGAGVESLADPSDGPLQNINRSPADQHRSEFIRKSGTGGPPSAREKIRSYFGRAQEAWQANWAQQFQQGFLDQFTGIAQADKSVLGVTHLLPEQSNYVAARLANGGTSSVMRALLLHGQARWATNGQHLEKIEGTKGLLDIFAPLGEDVNDLFRWMIANRADRLFKEGKENNFTREEIDAGLAMGRDAAGKPRADFRAAALQYAAFKRSVLDIAEQAGLIKGESRKVWDQADYIPFYREVDKAGTFSATGKTTAGPVGKKGLAGQSSGIRTLKGGTQALNDPMENIIMNFSRLVDASLKNSAIVKTVKSYEVANSGIVEKLNHTFTGQIVPAQQVKKLLEEAGTPAAVMAVIPHEAFDGMAKMWALAPPAGPDVVRIMVDGKAEFYRVADPLLLKALTSFVPFDFPGLGVARAFKRVLTAAITSTPDFMVRNFIRDSISVQLVGRDGFNPGASLANVLRAYNEAGGSEAMLFAGASFQGGQYNANDPKGAAAQMRRALRRKGLSAAGVDARMARLLDTPAKLWDKWRHFGEATENANRLAVYAATGHSGKGATAAAFESKDIMDFSLRGSSPLYQVMADVLPFFNARVQGLYRVGRADPKRLLRYGLLMTALSTLLALANSGNDDYDELKDWDKDAYWHFWIKGEHFTIPKAFEVGAVFGTIPERIVRYIKGQDSGGKTFHRVVNAVVEQFAFDPVPQVVRPAINAWANKDTFRDRPIEGMRDEGKLPSERYNGTTSPTAVAAVRAVAPVADAIGLSPKKLEYLVQGYLGTVGMYALGLSDIAVNALTGAPPKPAGKTADLPVVKSFYRQEPARGTVFEDDLYKLRTEVDQMYRSVNAQRNAGNDEAADALEARHEKALDVRGMVDAAATTLAGLNKERDAIYADRTMTPADKRKAIDALTREKAEVARDVMKDPEVMATQ